MHPALSVIFFTVTAGAGYGLLMLLSLARTAQLAPSISSGQVMAMGIVGLLLVTAGLLASTFHLANPKNAWRAFTRFRTSWLSREAVFAVVFYPITLLWLLLEWTQGNTTLTAFLGFVVAVTALVVLVCTAMIYASLKTIRQWHTALTPVNFVLLALVPGSLLLCLMFAQQGLPTTPISVVALVVALVGALVKLTYFYWIGQPGGPTLNTALGFTRATVRLLDVGHSSETFHTREFGFQAAKAKLLWMRAITIGLAFVVPVILLSGALGAPQVFHALVAAVSAYAGVFAERWLFFAEARHVVNLYHGAQST